MICSESQRPLQDLAVVQVRLIFQLPAPFNKHFAEPLAFVHWFKDLRDPVEGVGMYLNSLSSRNRRQRASIIPLSQIQQSCHLIPVYGSQNATSLGWTASSIISEASAFYLNPYLRHRNFYLLRFRVDRYIAAQRACEESVRRMRQLTRG